MAQQVDIFQVDTLERAQHDNFFAPRNTIQFLEDQFIYTYKPQIKAGQLFNSFGKINVREYNASGTLIHNFYNNQDTLSITKILPLQSGGRIIMGNCYRHISLFGLDTTLNTDVHDEPASFLLIIGADQKVDYFRIMKQTLDVETDPGEKYVFFVELTDFHLANLNRLDLQTHELTQSAVFNGPRYFPDLHVTEDFVYICGSSISHTDYINGVAFTGDFPYRNLVMQLDYSGELIWVKTIQDITTSHMGFCEAPAQGVYFAMELFDTTHLGEFTLVGTNWGSDFLLTSIDASGNYLWATEIPNNTLCGFQIGRGFFMDSDVDFNIYIAGYSRLKIVWDNGFEVGDEGTASLPTILQYDNKGEIQKSFSGKSSNNAFFTTIDVNKKGDILACGLMLDDLTFDNFVYHSNDNTYKAFFVRIPTTTSSKVIETIGTKRLEVYPNPASHHVRMDGFPASAKVLIRVYDVGGKCVLSKTMEAEKLKIAGLEIHHLLPGNYVLETITREGKSMAPFVKI